MSLSREEMVVGILKRNGFAKNQYGQYANGKCIITIEEDHYVVSHYDDDFLDWMDWVSDNLVIYGLMGYLSWNNYIKRGYSR